MHFMFEKEGFDHLITYVFGFPFLFSYYGLQSLSAFPRTDKSVT
jgi:hypothetical protein